MSVYLPITDADREAMLARVGVPEIDGLFADIPESLRLREALALGQPLSEYEVMADARAKAAKCRPAASLPCFLGAGVYDRLVPAAIRHLTQRSEFYTAYTPYQPEISQGTLQAIFEFQTMITSLTGMDVANASVYDGASGCAEAMLMAVNHTKRKKFIVSETVHPEAREVVSAYAWSGGIEIVSAPAKDGVTDRDGIGRLMADDVAGVLVQSPNFYGAIEDVAGAADAAHAAGAVAAVYVADALSLAVLKSPGESGADICVGEGQGFGLPMNYGGPHLGFMAVKQPLMRKLPGRIVGETVDVDGRRAFVLTLQAREQHIRREKATSNICSNQGLNALSATIYLSLLGRDGVKEVAARSMANARYLKERLEGEGFAVLYTAPFFDEFVICLPSPAADVSPALLERGVIGGLAVDGLAGGAGGAMLVCATEKRTKAEMDAFAEALKEVCYA
ncbi:MAG: aminomethyl-transferring glycine dehydrogenase subunit GcvPA [Clostridiales Family XIII bacterium]|jgi:glycine dehydrogenase subunit 1|nr:aminomethyl-transferring glycine dehydrogenase subunit GcvPA [Clostridiales Family XIII bacterium]